MSKQLYDPHMFNYMWESLDRDRFVVGTYYIEDTMEGVDFIDHLAQVQRLALEGSTASWMEVKEETPELRERLTSKVLNYLEIPSVKGTKKAIVQLAFPIAAWEENVNVPMMLLSIMGNIPAFTNKMRMLDLYIPPSVASKFNGPKFGIPGLREKLGVYDRPLVLQIIKPKMGMTPQQTADQVYQTALGGADLCKDDEMCSELSNCRFEDRLEAVLKALDKAERETGHKTLYMVSITDEADRVVEKARRAVSLGATGLLYAYSAGLSSLKTIANDPGIDAPILLHVSHMLALLPSMNFPVLSKLCRMCGADMMLTPSIWSSIPVASPEECGRVCQTLQAPFYNIKPTWPMPAAGMYPGLVDVLIQENGIDFIVPAGGGMLGHPMGYKAGAMAWRQAFDAVLKDGITLQEAAKKYKEFGAAAETWGIRERPVTPWGYSGPEYHPKFAPKNL
ncbi:MAG: RuBisCO large subunit C-terminal-like domain-containing protein [Chloroflexi bacterium]|nr:RuBisCO large subunit C-terminal-like domain-containing protein [Chloroflexota bacterium]